MPVLLRNVLWLCACMLAAAQGAQAQAATQPPLLAVFPARLDGLSDATGAALENALRAAAQDTGSYTLQERDSTRKTLAGARALGVMCDDTQLSCAVTLGKIAGVSHVVLVHAVKVLNAGADHVGLHVQLIDVGAERRVHHVRALVPIEPDAQRMEVKRVATILLRAESTHAAVVRVVPDGASVVVDGIDVGVSPLAEPIDGLVAGAHVLTVKKRGMLDHVASFDARPASPVLLTVTLLEDPAAVRVKRTALESALPWVTAGVGGAVLVGGVVATVIGVDPFNRAVDAEAALKAADPADDNYPAFADKKRIASDKAYSEWVRYGQASVIVGGVAIGVGAVAAVAGVSWGLLRPADGAE